KKAFLGFSGSPSLAEPKQVNRGFTVAAWLVSVPVVVEEIPSKPVPGVCAPSAVDVACIAGGLATEQAVAGHLVWRQRGVARQEGVEFRRERADLLRFFEGVQRLPP